MSLWQAVILHALEFILVVVILAFTSPTSPLRLAMLPLLAALSFCSIPLNRDSLPTKLAAGCVSLNAVGTLLQYVDRALISRWSYLAGGPTSASGGQPNAPSVTPRESHAGGFHPWKRLRWAWFTISTWRAPATPWEVKNVPYFDSHNPTRIPTWKEFVASKVSILLLCVLLLDLLSLVPQDAARNWSMFAWEKVPFFARLRDVSAEEATVRLVVSTVGWVSIYCVMNACYCTLALVNVVVMGSPVAEWPPLFGSVGDCYSIRQFWGRFWHQTLRQRIGSPSFFVTYKLLGLRQGGGVGRYLNIFLTFGVSGMLHVAEEFGTGVSISQSGSMRFFCTQALGIVLEDAIQAAFHACGGRPRRWHRAVGYVWFALWMTWSSPAWLYPKLASARADARDQLLPFRMLGPIFVNEALA